MSRSLDAENSDDPVLKIQKISHEFTQCLDKILELSDIMSPGVSFDSHNISINIDARLSCSAVESEMASYTDRMSTERPSDIALSGDTLNEQTNNANL